eukprot:2033901-Heterocapsa_arctica.AAC.1
MVNNGHSVGTSGGGATKFAVVVSALALVACLGLGGYAVMQNLPGHSKVRSSALRPGVRQQTGEQHLAEE